MNAPLIIGEVGTAPVAPEAIIIELQKDDVIRLLCGSDIPEGGIPMLTYVDAGLLYWNRTGMQELPIDELMRLYALLHWNPAPPPKPSRIVIA